MNKLHALFLASAAFFTGACNLQNQMAKQPALEHRLFLDNTHKDIEKNHHDFSFLAPHIMIDRRGDWNKNNITYLLADTKDSLLFKMTSSDVINLWDNYPPVKPADCMSWKEDNVTIDFLGEYQDLSDDQKRFFERAAAADHFPARMFDTFDAEPYLENIPADQSVDEHRAVHREVIAPYGIKTLFIDFDNDSIFLFVNRHQGLIPLNRLDKVNKGLQSHISTAYEICQHRRYDDSTLRDENSKSIAVPLRESVVDKKRIPILSKG